MKCFFAAVLFAAMPATAPAAPGHGHDHGEEAPAQAGAAALPRFAATSETFELVGVVEGQRLTLYLDRAADNSPVKDAQVQVELGGATIEVKPHGEGEFEATLPRPLQPGVTPVTATVIAGTETDLLAGELDVHEAAHAEETAHVHGWQEYGAWALGGLALIALLVWLARRVMRMRGGRPA